MRLRKREEFTTIRTEGVILPPDLLARVREGDGDLEGLRPEDYHLVAGEKINERVSRSWNRVVGAWATFQTHAEKVKEDDPGTTVTRERWLLPLFEELGYGRLQTSKAHELNGKSYPISHEWGCAPIHLVGLKVPLDRRTAGVAGAARTSPHSLVQEFLNRSDDHLWAFLSNGRQLRILRDNASLTRQAYVEFDLEAMMEGEVYADFALLWLLCHQSRVEGAVPEDFWLERWSQAAQAQGTRALEQLRQGVESAISVLGAGYLAHPANLALKERLREGDLEPQEYYRQLLRMVYRLIFLFVAEDRELIFDPEAEQEEKTRYREHYSTVRLRHLAERRRGTRHPDLYRGLCVVMGKMGTEEGCPELGLPGLGGFVWSKEAVADLAECQLANCDLLEVVRSLAFTEENRIRRAVDYKNLGPEELGSVYESLLELQPDMNVDAPTFELKAVGGSERKTTGSYYTPTSLIQCLLDSALDPVVEEAFKEDDPEQALLNLKICDPACGSGHFLVAAAHRLARRLASVRTGDEEPSPEAHRTALREVIGRCIYGVDINPMAVELCKVNLWLEAIDPGKPLSFLDDQILCGNSLLGTTPALMEIGIPDDAFKPIEGDDKKFASSLKKQNKHERPKEDLLEQGIASAQSSMFADFEREGRVSYALLQKEAIGIAETDDSSVKVVREKGEKYRALLESEPYRHSKLMADAWCAAFVWHKKPEAPEPITEATYRKLASNPKLISIATKKEIEHLAEQYHFFHWHLTFPGVFWLPEGEDEPENEQTGWSNGFDVMLGNPPWERIKLQEKEWFAGRNDDIANAPNKAGRVKLISLLKDNDPELYEAFLDDKRQADGQMHFSRNSNRYPLCGQGDINTYALFSELSYSLISRVGMAGLIVPDTIATTKTTSDFFSELVENEVLKSLIGFKNERFLFPSVEHTVTFALMTICGQERGYSEIEFCWLAWTIEETRDDRRRVNLGKEDFAILNPNTRTCPVFLTSADADLTGRIYRDVPVLINEALLHDSWGASFTTMFHMANDSGLFRNRMQLESYGFSLLGNSYRKNGETFLPLYEAKMMHQYDHRYGSYETRGGDRGFSSLPRPSNENYQDPDYLPMPYYWINEGDVESKLENKRANGWLLGFREIARNTDIRSAIASVLPRVGIGNKIPLVFLNKSPSFKHSACFLANLNSMVLDYVLRQKHGGTSISFYIMNQLPFIPPSWYGDEDFELLIPRITELVFTSYDLYSFAEELGYSCPPFVWDETRRFILTAEIDAYYALKYGLTDDDLLYILDPQEAHGEDFPGSTFKVLKEKEINQFGEYRTKAILVDTFRQMHQAWEGGESYQTRLDPPPADPSLTHPTKE